MDVILLILFYFSVLAEQISPTGFEHTWKNYDSQNSTAKEFNDIRSVIPPLKSTYEYTIFETPQITCNPQYKYRSFDGSCNNLKNPTWGMSLTKYDRLLPANYRDGMYLPRVSIDGNPLPLPRVLSKLLFHNINNEDKQLSLLGMNWPQFIGHDVVSSKEDQPYNCCEEPNRSNETICIPIEVPEDDCFYSQFNVTCLNLNRNTHFEDELPRNQINFLTQMFDGSQVYGSNKQLASSLRSFKDGKLRTSESDSELHFLPLLSNDSYLAGEPRVGQNPTLAILHTVLVREHNRVVKKLAENHDNWNDEKLYQEARAIVAAELQHITYNEWLPLIVGEDYAFRKQLLSGSTTSNYDYDDRVHPIALNSFTASAFRVGHSGIQGTLDIYQKYDKCPMLQLSLSDLYYKPRIIEENGYFDNFLRGVTKQPMQILENYYTREITEKLFRNEKQYGSDLLSRDITRGRDHGIQPYVKYVELCLGYQIKTFDDLTMLIPNKTVTTLKTIYHYVEDIDLHVGGVLENHAKDARVGPTFQCIISEQLYRLKFGDRFWYEVRGQPHSFTLRQLQQIKKATIARLICDNSDIKVIPPRSLFQLSDENLPIDCDQLPSINLDHF